jgi:hypothetical protein
VKFYKIFYFLNKNSNLLDFFSFQLSHNLNKIYKKKKKNFFHSVLLSSLQEILLISYVKCIFFVLVFFMSSCFFVFEFYLKKFFFSLSLSLSFSSNHKKFSSPSSIKIISLDLSILGWIFFFFFQIKSFIV